MKVLFGFGGASGMKGCTNQDDFSQGTVTSIFLGNGMAKKKGLLFASRTMRDMVRIVCEDDTGKEREKERLCTHFPSVSCNASFGNTAYSSPCVGISREFSPNPPTRHGNLPLIQAKAGVVPPPSSSCQYAHSMMK